MDKVLEFRNSKPVEYRADKRQLVGYAAVFYQDGDQGTEFSPFEGHREVISPKAFDAAFERGDDVYATFNHDDDNLLARLSAGTLRLNVDKIGLKYEIDLADTTIARDVAESAKRGDIPGSSFQFVVDDQRISRDEDGRTTREILSVNPLIEVGPVTNPAFEGTSVSTRSKDAIQAEIDEYAQAERRLQRAKRMDELTAKLEKG